MNQKNRIFYTKEIMEWTVQSFTKHLIKNTSSMSRNHLEAQIATKTKDIKLEQQSNNLEKIFKQKTNLELLKNNMMRN